MNTSSVKIAGIMPVKNYSDRCSAFHQLKQLCDITIVLDHNSATPFPYRSECDEYLTLNHAGPWCDAGNRTLLMYHAFARGCEWVVQMDDDHLFGHKFQTRKDVLSVIELLQSQGKEEAVFKLRELWDNKDHYRQDGVWGQKVFRVVRKNFFFKPKITLPSPMSIDHRLHSPANPTNYPDLILHLPSHVIYHTGCMTLDQRRQRVAKYAKEDPGNRIYDYMLDNRWIELRVLPTADQNWVDRNFRENS